MSPLARAPWFARLLLAELAAFAVWAFLVNRVVIQWPDSRGKSLTIAALCVVLGLLAAASARRARRSRLLHVWCALLVLFGVGELRRIGLRHAYGAATTEASLWRPVTTWQLAVRRFSL
ncbi:MAG TPA: hypothetical protein VGM29_11860, partial [Polyangiaceae bacterium]